MAVTYAQCPVCEKAVAVNGTWSLRVHGSPEDRCAGSGRSAEGCPEAIPPRRRIDEGRELARMLDEAARSAAALRSAYPDLNRLPTAQRANVLAAGASIERVIESLQALARFLPDRRPSSR